MAFDMIIAPEASATALSTVRALSAHYASMATPEATRRAYATATAQFEAWCASLGLDALPADESTIAAYLAHRASGGAKVATVALDLSAISAAHRAKGYPIDARSGELARVWGGVRNEHVQEQRQAEPVTQKDLLDAVALLGDDPKGVRDRAILLFGFAAARRRSELVTLDLGHVGAGRGCAVVGASGVEITLRGSKSARDEATKFAVLREYAPLAVEALERWIAVAGIEPGTALFRGVNNSGTVAKERLADIGINRAIKSCMVKLARHRGLSVADANAFAAKFSGHSLRVGFAVAAVNADAGHEAIADHLGHASTEMTRRYAKKAKRGRAVKGVGL